jgi:hypothetical protein
MYATHGVMLGTASKERGKRIKERGRFCFWDIIWVRSLSALQDNYLNVLCDTTMAGWMDGWTELFAWRESLCVCVCVLCDERGWMKLLLWQAGNDSLVPAVYTLGAFFFTAKWKLDLHSACLAEHWHGTKRIQHERRNVQHKC